MVRVLSILTTSRSYHVTWATRSFADNSPSAPGLSARSSSTLRISSSQVAPSRLYAADEIALVHRAVGRA